MVAQASISHFEIWLSSITNNRKYEVNVIILAGMVTHTLRAIHNMSPIRHICGGCYLNMNINPSFIISHSLEGSEI
jgi:hypothetical protein